MFCCACNGTCSHVGPHSYCAAHGGSFIPTTTAPNTGPFVIPNDVRRAVESPFVTNLLNEIAVDALIDLIALLADSEPCRYDHDNNCQTHNLDARPCPHGRAQKLLTTREANRAAS